jgi:SHS2 domain-containing protein
MGESAGYRFLEHVTDALIEAWGSDLKEAFAQAGIALFETMLDSNTVRSKTSEEIHSMGHDEKELLYNYLEQLLLLFEIKQLAIGKVDVDSIIAPRSGELRLKARATGEPYDRVRHHGKVEIKGVTYHLMEIERQPKRVTVRFLLDL